MCHNYQTISEVFGECKWMGRESGLTGKHHALVQTNTFPSSLGPLHSNLLMSARSSCSLLPHYPVSLIHVFAVLLLSLFISVPVFKHSSSSSPVGSMTTFSFFPPSSWSPATGPQPASRLVTALIICVCFPKPKWGLRLIPGKFQPNQLQLCQNLNKLLFWFFFKYRI